MPECSDDTTWDFGLALFPTKDQGTTKARGALTQTDGDEERNQTPTSVAIPPQASREIRIRNIPRPLWDWFPILVGEKVLILNPSL